MSVKRPVFGMPDLADTAPLDITRVPRVGLAELQVAMDDVIWWEQHRPITREDRIARDDAFVRLMQARWHVQQAMIDQAAMPQDQAA